MTTEEMSYQEKSYDMPRSSVADPGAFFTGTGSDNFENHGSVSLRGKKGQTQKLFSVICEVM